MINAKDKKLSEVGTSLPDVSGGVQTFFQPMVFQIIKKNQVAGYPQERKVLTIKTNATRQPLNPSAIALKPEGQRTWNWERIHATPDLKLNLDDRIMFNGRFYRVMEQNDFSEYGYLEYHVAQDFDEVSEP